MDKRVRVRYAPSPTGYQHIGGIRTALFNYLFARVNNGDFILRIEDTDRTRYFDGALEDIFETFKWLGIDYDEGPEKEGSFGPYFQSKRIDIYKKYAEELINKGWAYYCYCDAERLERVRKEKAEKKESNIGYDRYCRNISEQEAQKLKKKTSNPVVRLKVPLEGKTFFEDKLFGKIEVDNSTLQDFVLLKSDGFPTYHLANIVDDHLMEISHVLRAQEWIPSTPNHVLLYKAFGWTPPQFCHLPMVMGKDGQKLSKRHGATQVKEFKDKGYLPEAIINFIVLLGWAFDDKQEIFSLDDLKKCFDINKINKSSAVFDYMKLDWFNGFYIRKKSIDELLDLTLPFYKTKELISTNLTDEELNYLKKVIPLIQERIEFINEAPDKSDFMFGEIPPYKAWEQIIPKKTDKDTVIKILSDSKEILNNLGRESVDDLQHKLYDLSQKYNVKAGAVFMPIRIAVTGTNKSPELFPVMEVLGKERVLNRIEEAIKKLQNK
jgi:glutamyl-tRNA synthetase